LAQVKLSVSPAIFATWFKSTSIISIKNGESPGRGSQLPVKRNPRAKIPQTNNRFLREIDISVREVFFTVVKDAPIKTPKLKPAANAGSGQLGFDEFKFNKETNLNPKYSF
jgi:hypothetical protein